MKTLPLRTNRLALDAMAETDAPALRRIVTTPSVGRMLFLFPPDWTDDDARAFIRRTRFTGAPPFRLGVYRDGALVGSVGVGAGPVPDIYYFLDPAAQGQGIANEALVAFLRFLFDDLGLDAVGADVFHDNPASAHILARLGFAKTGDGTATSAARLEPAPISLYRLSAERFGAAG
ncbi:GNAT family N-acetyltransferase [Thalassococcus sp. CAU 1522]|uniref:GNAT family N-acetyltransferase n=1 Tax=Thalassococcus arenae TaxID=2851652 RepID=A0ABS6N9V2_9RHOB|nr:GNAT family N-acetyltransferase [Thalassococcus arenae]MBV2360796.1 GNAT family N-acetyltransferase [Thalassococcus arenae]